MKESVEGAIEVEAKEVSNKLPMERVNANDNETRGSLNKPAEDVTKELEEGVIGVNTKDIETSCWWRELKQMMTRPGYPSTSLRKM